MNKVFRTQENPYFYGLSAEPHVEGSVNCVELVVEKF